MKQYFLFIAICIEFGSCSLDDSKNSEVNLDDDISIEEELISSIDSISQQLEGTWLWVYSSGGIAGTINTPESTGYTAKLEISDGIVKGFRNDSLIYAKNYSIVIHYSTNTIEPHLDMVYEGGAFPQYFIVNEDELELVDECSDCFQSLYKRE
ncbi:MAG: hypothetical protein R2785_02240 [Flavobacteriaceae bacterium]